MPFFKLEYLNNLELIGSIIQHTYLEYILLVYYQSITSKTE
jgi:hypothetical protein